MSLHKGRLGGLDGVRGVAAFIVVVHHTALTVPVLANAYFGGAVPASLQWFTYSPLHLLWDGAGPVFVFFVLSGLVVPLPAFRAKSFSWAGFYRARLVRLYLPVWASLGIAYVTILLVPRVIDSSRSYWLQLHAGVFGLPRIAKDGILVTGTSWANGPLWTLQWEVIFSLLLPLYVALGWLARKSLAIAAALASVGIGLVAIGGVINVDALIYLPMFAIGVCIGARLDDLARFAEPGPRDRTSALVWGGATLVAVVLLSARWCLEPILGDVAYPATFAPTIIGAALLVVVACASPLAARLLSTRPIAWAGRLSFSLYLVHDPIVVAVALILPASLIVVPQVLGIVVAIAVAITFQRFVERPSHALAKRVGRPIRSLPAQVPSWGSAALRTATRIVPGYSPSSR